MNRLVKIGMLLGVALIVSMIFPSAHIPAVHLNLADAATVQDANPAVPAQPGAVAAFKAVHAVTSVAQDVQAEQAAAAAAAAKARQAAAAAAAAKAAAVKAEVKAPPPPPVSVPSAGVLSFTQLEALWVSVGGNPAFESTAGCIAEQESSGRVDAVSPTSDFGLWQINSTHGAEASLNPVVNARAAVSISDDGTNWSQWTTHGACGV